MGNHCIKVVCDGCGEMLCLRCSWGFEPDSDVAARVRENIVNSDRDPIVFKELHRKSCGGRLVGKGWAYSQ